MGAGGAGTNGGVLRDGLGEVFRSSTLTGGDASLSTKAAAFDLEAIPTSTV